MAISVLAVMLVAAVVVLVHAEVAGDRADSLLAARSDPVTEEPAREQPPDAAVPPRPSPPGPAAPAPADPVPTATAPSPATTSTTAPAAPGVIAACTALEHDARWEPTGDRTTLDAAAGTTGTAVAVLTNRSDEPCRVRPDPCGVTAELRDLDGSARYQPPRPCAPDDTELVLEPGEGLEEELTVPFGVAPGEYRVHVRRGEGPMIVLPVRLDDRLPACESGGLLLEVNGSEVVRDRDDVSEHGLQLDLVVTGAEEGCTLRVTETRVVLVATGHRVEIVDEAERWAAPSAGGDVHTHAVAAPTELEPAEYDGTVEVVLAGGAEMVAPFRLLVA